MSARFYALALMVFAVIVMALCLRKLADTAADPAPAHPEPVSAMEAAALYQPVRFAQPRVELR